MAAINGSGTANYVPIFTSASDIGNSIICNNGSFVGVGYTSDPKTGNKLAINGACFVNGLLQANNDLYVDGKAIFRSLATTTSTQFGLYLINSGNTSAAGATTAAGVFGETGSSVWYGSTALVFKVNPGPDTTSNAAVEAMRITPGKKLLLGASSPTIGAPTLDVTGSIGSTALAASSVVFTDANKVLTTTGVVAAANGGAGNISGILKANGSGIVSQAVAGTDYLVPFGSQTQNTFYAAPNGSAGTPTFRAIVAADIPTLNQNTTGSAATLATTRTIWGQNFNGSANVSGALTGVTDITTSGDINLGNDIIVGRRAQFGDFFITAVSPATSGASFIWYDPASQSVLWNVYDSITSNVGAILLAGDYFESTVPITAPSFLGAGTGLTGTATALNIGGNAGTVTNGVYTNTSQTISGSKTFSTATYFNDNIHTHNIRIASGYYQVFDSGSYYGTIQPNTLSTFRNWYWPNADGTIQLTDGTGANGTWGIGISGNAATATILATGRTIAITGDISYTSSSFNGSGNVTGTGTLATVNSNVGSFGSASSVPTFTVNAKGLITAAGNTTIAIAQSQVTNLVTDLAGKQSTITFGTGVQTALGVNIGSAGAPILFNGAGGTPSSMVGTNITGVASGLSIGGNAATVTNGVYTTGNQQIYGIKTWVDQQIFWGGVVVDGYPLYLLDGSSGYAVNINFAVAGLTGNRTVKFADEGGTVVLGTGAKIKLGAATAGGGSFSNNYYLPITIDGVLYYIAMVN